MPTHRISSTFLLSMCLALAPVFASAVDQSAEAPAPIVRMAKLTTTDIGSETIFGWSVAISGDTVVIGAPGAQVGSKVGRPMCSSNHPLAGQT